MNVKNQYCLDGICDLKKDLISWAGQKDCTAEEVPIYGQVIDMIKDLCEAEEKCRKAEYYRLKAEEINTRSMQI